MNSLDNITLRKVQLVQLEIAKEIDRICKKNNIKYFLIGGSLLGAIRHQGFIPWDDDLDVGMLRDDYEKFLKVAGDELQEKYKIIDWKSDGDYPHPMGKVIKRGTVYKESKRNDSGDQGIWVDVFPYDNVENNLHLFKRRIFKLKVLRSLIRAKCDYQTWQSDKKIIISKYIKNIPFRIAAMFLEKNKLIKKYEYISEMSNDKNSTKVFENGTENYIDWCFEKEYFMDLIKMDFEDCKLCVPKQYHAYLSLAYGDYMKLPPVQERENKHLIVEVDFGQEKSDL